MNQEQLENLYSTIRQATVNMLDVAKLKGIPGNKAALLRIHAETLKGYLPEVLDGAKIEPRDALRKQWEGSY